MEQKVHARSRNILQWLCLVCGRHSSVSLLLYSFFLQVSFTLSTTLEDAQSFVAALHEWLEAILKNMNLLVFFTHRNSALFSAVLEQELRSIVEKREVDMQPPSGASMTVLQSTLFPFPSYQAASHRTIVPDITRDGLSLEVN